MSELALCLHDLRFSYGSTLVVECNGLDVEAGSFVAMIGPNGGGKSTLLRLLLGLLEPDQGSIQVLGRSPRSARRQVGYMPQHQHLDSSFPITVEEVVRMGALSGGFWPRFDRLAADRVQAALERVGCAELRRRPFAPLSGGQRQLVLIARALVDQPRLLLLDEPTANLDPAVQDDFFRLLGELRGESTVVLVSHDVGFVSRFADQVICVNREVVCHPATEVDGAALASMFGDGLMVDHDHRHDSSHHHGH